MPVEDNITGSPSLKLAAIVTPIVLLVLLAMAVLFFKERMLYIDSPHVLFRIMNDGHFHIEEHRYGSFISQMFPWVGVHLQMPLSGLMILYSTGFYLFYLAVALIIVYKFKNYGLAVLLGLYFTLFVSSTYYWPNNEVHQGITWLLLAFAVNFSEPVTRLPLFVRLLLFAGLFFFALWTHPLVMLAAVYLWFFYALQKGMPAAFRGQTLIFSVVLVVLAYVKFYQGMHHGYDSGKIETLTAFDTHRLRHIFSSPQFHFFIRGCVGQYLLFSVIFVAGLLGLLLEKKYLLFTWTILFVMGYVFLISVTYWDATSPSYLESEYSPLVIICSAPFVYYVVPKMRPRWSLAAFGMIYCIRVTCIVIAAAPFTNRLVIMGKMMENMRTKNLTKAIVTNSSQTDEALITKWGAPVESLFLSKLSGEMPQRTFIFLDSAEMKTFNTASKDTLLGTWEKRAAMNINGRYISMDTSVPYTVISYSKLME